MFVRDAYRFFLVFHLVIIWTGSLGAAEIHTDAADDEKALRDARLATDSAGLLALFRANTLSEARRVELTALVRLLGDDAYTHREKAAADLVRAGRLARPMLRAVLDDPDREIARRAERCLQAIDENDNPTLLSAATRLLAERRPDGAIGILLDYLSTEEDEFVQEAVLQTLVKIGLNDGKPDGEITTALVDRNPTRRMAAAFVLGHANPDEGHGLHRLLMDSDATVRFHAAVALARAGDRRSVPVLIGMLTDGPPALAWQAEDLLFRMAGEQAPVVPLKPEDKDIRGKRGAAWETWWSLHEDKIDLAKLNFAEPLLGLTVISEFDSPSKSGMGRVWECARDGNVRWQIDNVQGPIDVQILSGGRLLIAEHQGHRVTERDRQGQILWEKRVTNHPVSCQRLKNGNTFIATYTELLEVNRTGQTVYSYKKPDRICAAQKLVNGHILYVHNQNHFIELGADGKEVVSVAIGDTAGWAGIESLANGRYLVALYNSNKVVEVGADGKVFWECFVKAPAWATRLPNGNTLVASTEANSVVEFDRSSKEVWRQATSGRPFRARPR